MSTGELQRTPAALLMEPELAASRSALIRTFPMQNEAPDFGPSFTALKWDKLVVPDDVSERQLQKTADILPLARVLSR